VFAEPKTAQPTSMWAIFVWQGQLFFFFLLEAQGQNLVWQGQSKMCQIVERKDAKKKNVKKRKIKVDPLKKTAPHIIKNLQFTKNKHRI
jgi:hypothetical protein